VEPGLVILGCVGVVAGVIALSRRLNRGPGSSSWLRGGGDRRLAAELRKAAAPLRVDVSAYARERGQKGVRIAISGLCPGVSLRGVADAPAAGALDFGAQMRDAIEVEVGDPRFDEALRVTGQPALVHALMTSEARGAVLALLARPFVEGVSLVDGTLQVDVPLYATAQAQGALLKAGEAAIEAARRLQPIDDVPARLMRAVRHDPQAGVRAQAVAVLAREEPPPRNARETLRAAARQPHAEVRLRAALALGPEGDAVLIALAGDDSAPPECVTRAIRALGARLPFDDARAALERALARGQLQAARACMDAVADHGGAAAVDVLGAVLDRFTGAAGAAAAAALAAVGPAAEGALIATLEVARDEARLCAVAAALGAVGSPEAAGRLREAGERHGGDVALAAQRALAAIQERVGGTPGQLSLSAGAGGQVSLGDDSVGRVSLERVRGES
jgi:hypothetical protein